MVLPLMPVQLKINVFVTTLVYQGVMMRTTTPYKSTSMLSVIEIAFMSNCIFL